MIDHSKEDCHEEQVMAEWTAVNVVDAVVAEEGTIPVVVDTQDGEAHQQCIKTIGEVGSMKTIDEAYYWGVQRVVPYEKTNYSKYILCIYPTSSEESLFEKEFSKLRDAKKYAEKEYTKYYKQVKASREFDKKRGLVFKPGHIYENHELSDRNLGRNKKEAEIIDKISRMYSGPIYDNSIIKIKFPSGESITLTPYGTQYNWVDTKSLTEAFWDGYY